MKRIKISKETEELVRSMSKMGDSYDSVIYRGFSYLNKDSEFWNQE